MNLNKKDSILSIMKEAGAAIMKIYNDPVTASIVDHKADDSPLTLADQTAHEIIDSQLSNLFPSIPIISEEGKGIDYEDRKDYNEFWLVDPLDGTKEFINRNGEFTVNIALIRNRIPVEGYIYVPVKDVHYFGNEDGAYKIDNGKKTKIRVNNSTNNRIAVRSKSHPSPEEETVLNEYDAKKSISVGSSLKFCMVAEGRADVYYRHGPTMEWDTAAGQAIVQAAGGRVYKEVGPDLFTYNKENLLNTGFLCLGF